MLLGDLEVSSRGLMFPPQKNAAVGKNMKGFLRRYERTFRISPDLRSLVILPSRSALRFV